jgi:hypothetical protein
MASYRWLCKLTRKAGHRGPSSSRIGYSVNVTFAVAADAANASTNGKLNILGAFNQIAALRFPVRHPQMVLVVRFTAGPAEIGSEKAVRYALHDADGRELLSLDTQLIVPPPDAPGRTSEIDSLVNLAGVVFPSAGDYSFHILINGDTKGTVPIRVIQLTDDEEESDDYADQELEDEGDPGWEAV